MEDLLQEYKNKKTLIKKRLKDFKKAWNQTDNKIFAELCFCICTPQSRAVYCDKAISRLEKSGALYKGGLHQIRSGLKAVRFPNNKSRFIIEARKLFTRDGTLRIKEKLDTKNVPKTRLWLVQNVKGLGFKEASHFLRNIGFGEGLAILDVHIIKNMIEQGIIKKTPKSTSKAVYFALEAKLEEFARKISIPLGELDLLFWSMETGEIFK